MDDVDRYLRAAHALQTGLAYELAQGSDSASPKHLRVGINSAMCAHTALVRLLIAKGLFTQEEYLKEQADEMEREVGRLSEQINAKNSAMGKVHLV